MLDGKHAIVTGGSAGIGAAVTEALVRERERPTERGSNTESHLRLVKCCTLRTAAVTHSNTREELSGSFTGISFAWPMGGCGLFFKYSRFCTFEHSWIKSSNAVHCHRKLNGQPVTTNVLRYVCTGTRV